MQICCQAHSCITLGNSRLPLVQWHRTRYDGPGIWGLGGGDLRIEGRVHFPDYKNDCINCQFICMNCYVISISVLVH